MFKTIEAKFREFEDAMADAPEPATDVEAMVRLEMADHLARLRQLIRACVADEELLSGLRAKGARGQK